MHPSNMHSLHLDLPFFFLGGVEAALSDGVIVDVNDAVVATELEFELELEDGIGADFGGPGAEEDTGRWVKLRPNDASSRNKASYSNSNSS